jgi:hypothetical protein
MLAAITRTVLNAAALRAAAARSKDAVSSRRRRAPGVMLEGGNRTDAARAAGMHQQTLRDRVHPVPHVVAWCQQPATTSVQRAPD